MTGTQYTFERGKIEKTEENKKWYDRRGYHMTGETLKQTALYYGDGTMERPVEEICEYIVFKGSWTRYDTVRDCGDHYIIARYSRWDRIDKATMEITFDVEDK